MNLLEWGLLLTPVTAYFVMFGVVTVQNRKRKQNKKHVIHNKFPHSCNVIMSSVACFEHNGEFWIKEYLNDKQREGRTYQVNYCPWCGTKAPYTIP